MRARLAAAALLVLTAACGGSKSQPPPPPPVSLAFVVDPGPSSAVSPIAPAVKVELRDASGHLVSTATSAVTLSLAPGSGSAVLAGTTTAQAAAGVATFSNLSVAVAGTGYKLSATSTGLTGATSAAFDVSVGPPARLSFVTQPAGGRTSTTFAPALEVLVEDAAGNPTDAADVTVTLASGPGSGALVGTATVTPAAGHAIFSDLTVRGAGTYTLRAALPGGPAATTAAFALTDAWRSIGPDGGLVTIAADPVTPLTALAGGPGRGGLWRTTDGGGTWTPVDAVTGRTLLPVFEKADTAWAYGDSVWRSTDGGATWTEAPGVAITGDRSAVGLAFDPVTHVAHVATNDYAPRIMSSSDGGASWAVMAPALPDGAVPQVIAAGPGGLYALSGQGFHALPRGATAWTAPVVVESNPYRMVAHPTDSSVILVGGIFGLHRTTDGGATWATTSTSMFKDLWIDPANPSSVLGAALVTGVYGSTDGGATFNSIPSPPAMNLVSISGTASRLYLGAETGPYSSTDGGATWSKASTGLRASTISAVAVSPGASPVLLAGSQAGELNRSIDGGATWTRVLYVPGQRLLKLVFDPGTPARVYLVNEGYLMVSTDAGATWSDLAGSPPGVGSVAICRQVPGTLWVSDLNGTGVWRTTDSGTTWTRVYTRPRTSPLAGEVAADAVDPLVGYMTLIDYAPGGAGTGLYRTQDAGTTWTKLTIPAYAAYLAAGPAAGSIWVAGGNGVNFSTDFGATYSALSPPINGRVFAMALDQGDGSRAVLGTVQPYAGFPTDGVLITADVGATWTSSRSGHDLFSTYSVAIDPNAPQTIYAGTLDGGLLVSTTGGL